LQDLADDASASGNDLVDITSDTPSDRSTDNIITLLGTYNIDDTAAEHLYAGSITQADGDTVYSGLQVLGAVNNTNTQLMVVQNNDLYQFTTNPEVPFWGDQSTGGYNGNTASGILMRILVKSRVGGADIDGKRIRVQSRQWGDTYDFFNVTLGQGEAVAAIGTTPDAQNTTAQGTVNSYTHVLNSNTIPVNGQDETAYDNSPTSEGTFTGGTGYATSDVITLSDGTTVLVDNQAAGVVTEFTVTSTYSRGAVSTDTLTQDSVSPAGGSGFSLTLDTDNVQLDPNNPRGGFQTIDLNNGSGLREYYSQWTFTTDTSGDGLKGVWEYVKDISANGTVPVNAQDETSYDNTPTTEGTFSGGTGHANTDVITLSDGSTVTVDLQAGGVVTQFTVDATTSTGGAFAGKTLTQTATTGSGTGFSLTLDTDNVTPKKTIDAIDGELFLGITHSFAYNNEVGGPFEEHETIYWGTEITYDGLTGTFNVGEYVSFEDTGLGGAPINGGKVLADSGTVLTVALENPTAGVIVNDDGIRGVTSGATAVVNVTITNDDKAGGEGLLLALDDDGTTGNLYIQLISGSAPVTALQVSGRYSGATADVNGAPTARTVPKIFLGSYTGSLIGAYGIGVDPDDLTASDSLEDLSGTTQNPPNNVTFTVTGLISGEDRVLVGPRAAGILQKNQDTINGTLTDGVTTSVVTTTAIPSDTPSGPGATIRVEDDNGVYTRQVYTSYTGSTYTLTGTYEGSDNANATTGNDIFISYIDELASGTTASFTTVYSSDRDLFVRVRDGGATPIKTFEAPATLGSGGGSIAAIRTSDA
jgi:hypothetical protein